MIKTIIIRPNDDLDEFYTTSLLDEQINTICSAYTLFNELLDSFMYFSDYLKVIGLDQKIKPIAIDIFNI